MVENHFRKTTTARNDAIKRVPELVRKHPGIARRVVVVRVVGPGGLVGHRASGLPEPHRPTVPAIELISFHMDGIILVVEDAQVVEVGTDCTEVRHAVAIGWWKTGDFHEMKTQVELPLGVS